MQLSLPSSGLFLSGGTTPHHLGVPGVTTSQQHQFAPHPTHHPLLHPHFHHHLQTQQHQWDQQTRSSAATSSSSGGGGGGRAGRGLSTPAGFMLKTVIVTLAGSSVGFSGGFNGENGTSTTTVSSSSSSSAFPDVLEEKKNFTGSSANNNETVKSSSSSSISGSGGYSSGSSYSIAETIIIALVAGLLSIVTVLGNVMVMISFKMDKQLQTISNYFLLSLAIADFSIGLISMPLFTMYTIHNHWSLGPFICDTWLAFDYLNSNASVLNLLIISFDRYFSVTRPLTYRARRTTKRAACMIASAWLISLVLWPPWIYSWPYIEGKRTVEDNECYIQFLETNSYLTFGTALAAFYVPVTVMIILYWRIWRETEKRQKDLTHLQAGKKNDSKKSTSSDDPADEEYPGSSGAGPRGGGGGGPGSHNSNGGGGGGGGRSDSCLPSSFAATTGVQPGGDKDDDSGIETTYVPTSLCVETSKYISPSGKRSKRQSLGERLKERVLGWCNIDRDLDAAEEDSTSHGSPGATTPASIETPIQSSSRTTSMNFRQDQVVLQLNQAGNLPGGASSALHAKRMQMQHFDQGIPMLDRNGPRRTPASESGAQTTSVSTPSTSKLPASRSYSTDSVYTILIRLPTQQSLDGDPGSESNQASIKMIVEEDGMEAETSMASGGSVRGSESLGALSVYRANAGDSGNGSSSLRHGSLRASEIALETIRLPLNTRLVPKQIVKHRVPKKKRKQQERKQEKKAAKTLSAILLAFIITWTPYNVLVLIKTLSSCQDDDCIPMGLWNFAYYLCYINSTVNPLCYALCNANFRRTYIRILSCKWHNTNRHAVNRGYFS